jgi:hypothetical protein
MKKTNASILAVIVIVSFAACKNKAKETAKQNTTNLQVYVDSLKNITPNYTTGYWTSLDEGYQQRALLAEKTIADLEEKDIATFDSTKAAYAMLKSNYEAKLKAQEISGANKLNETEAQLKDEKNKNNTTPTAPTTSPDYRQVLRNRLFGEGRIGADMKFEFATANNILGIYDNFVNGVADNKNNYTREDWDEIKVLYEALDNRKNAIEKDLTSKDNMKIAGLKIRFASIKATQRTSSKIDENNASKN